MVNPPEQGGKYGHKRQSNYVSQVVTTCCVLAVLRALLAPSSSATGAGMSRVALVAVLVLAVFQHALATGICSVISWIALQQDQSALVSFHPSPLPHSPQALYVDTSLATWAPARANGLPKDAV